MLRALEKRPVIPMTSKWQSIILNRSCAPPVARSAEQDDWQSGDGAIEKARKVAYIRFASVYRSFEDIKELAKRSRAWRTKSCRTSITWRGAKAGATRTFYHASQPECRVVIVKDGEIVGEGYHQRAGEHMPKYTRCVWRVKKPKVRPPCHTRTL